MTSPARKRLWRDFQILQEDTLTGVSAVPNEDNIMIWTAIIFGPKDTPFEDGIFKLRMSFSEEYPSKPPSVRFVTKVFHPNVYESNGAICLDILMSKWRPSFGVAAILTSIQGLLGQPNPYSPANPKAAEMYKTNPREYKRQVKLCVDKTLELEGESAPEEYEPVEDIVGFEIGEIIVDDENEPTPQL